MSTMASAVPATENGEIMLPTRLPAGEVGGLRSSPITATLVAAGLVAVIGGGFGIIVLGGSALLGEDEAPTLLMVAATAVVAMAFEPAKRTLRRLANRVVYGHRSSPWEAVSRLSAEVGGPRDSTETLASVSETIASGTGASDVTVWLDVDGTLEPVAVHPPGRPVAAIAMDGDRIPEMKDVDWVAPVGQGGEVVGAITVTKPGPGSLTPIERGLVQDLAGSTGIILRTLLLRETRRHRLDVARRVGTELVASRARIVAAQDEARRRLERDLHDTCQQRAVVVAGRLGLAGVHTRRDPSQAEAALRDCAVDVALLASALVRVAEGGRPVELDSGGIDAALRAGTIGTPVPVELLDLTQRRYPRRIEEAVYLVCMEAIQNAVKHAEASHIRVRLTDAASSLTFSVSDDGSGFDTHQASTGTGLDNMQERMRGVDGRLVVRSSSAGTRIEVEIPVEPLEASS